MTETKDRKSFLDKDYTRRYDKERDKYFKALSEIPRSEKPIE